LAQRRQLALTQLFDIDADSVQDASSNTLPFASQTYQDVLSTHATVAETSNLVHSERQRPAGTWHHLEFLRNGRIAASNVAFDSSSDILELNTTIRQVSRCRSVLLYEQSKKQVFGSNVVVTEPMGFLGR
jgi:hypothetical protein